MSSPLFFFVPQDDSENPRRPRRTVRSDEPAGGFRPLAGRASREGFWKRDKQSRLDFPHGSHCMFSSWPGGSSEGFPSRNTCRKKSADVPPASNRPRNSRNRIRRRSKSYGTDDPVRGPFFPLGILFPLQKPVPSDHVFPSGSPLIILLSSPLPGSGSLDPGLLDDLSGYLG